MYAPVPSVTGLHDLSQKKITRLDDFFVTRIYRKNKFTRITTYTLKLMFCHNKYFAIHIFGLAVVKKTAMRDMELK